MMAAPMSTARLRVFAAVKSCCGANIAAFRESTTFLNRQPKEFSRPTFKAISLNTNYFSTVAKSSLPVELSERCIKRLKEITTPENEKYLRVIVDGGGCSGFQYIFELDNKIQKDDCLVEKDGVGVVIDKTSLEFMQGSTVDYGDELIRSSFRVVSNPKAEKGCSCGASFNVKGL